LQCPSCPATFASSSALCSHKLHVHAAARFYCRRCDAGFGKRDHYVRHRANKSACDVNLRKKKSRFQCPYCTARFTKKQNLGGHEARRRRNGSCPTIKSLAAMGGRR
jgi:hypothetical protein